MKIVNQEFKSIIEYEVLDISNYISNIIYDFDGVSFVCNNKNFIEKLTLELARDVREIYILIGYSNFLTVIFKRSSEELFFKENNIIVEMPEVISYDLFLSDKENIEINKIVKRYIKRDDKIAI